MQSHMMISDTDGHLYDTRTPGWHLLPPLRRHYRQTYLDIDSVKALKATLRNGAFTGVGGYPLYFITSDGAALSFDSVRSEFRNVAESIAQRSNDGWRVVACTINYEDSDLTCDHSGKPIPSAYGEDTQEESAQ